MEAFRRFFKIKTRREWEDRKAWGGVDGCFVYTAPKVGEPGGETLGEFVGGSLDGADVLGTRCRPGEA